jgi:hypothetical protein
MCALFVEIKPTVGDDYPAILRQMTRNRKPVGSTETYHILYTREINTKFVAEEDVVKIFKASGFHVIVDPS